MNKQYHILNGDALMGHFPKNIPGEFIVARECFVDGKVDGKGLVELYRTRANFLSDHYQVSPQDYYNDSVTEFEKIDAIKDDSEINLWFEDDLFCQVNFWFISYLLAKKKEKIKAYLIRPETHDQYGFGGLSEPELVSIYNNRSVITDLDILADLWIHYQNNDLKNLALNAKKLGHLYPFIDKAVEAHLDRLPDHNNEGRPIRSLKAIMSELKTDDFGIVFREFCKRESIYGFGDLHVKRLFDKIKNNSNPQ